MTNKRYVSLIRELCEERQITAYDLADLAQTTPSTVYNVMRDITKKPLNTLDALAAALDVGIADLYRVEVENGTN